MGDVLFPCLNSGCIDNILVTVMENTEETSDLWEKSNKFSLAMVSLGHPNEDVQKVVGYANYNIGQSSRLIMYVNVIIIKW